jgi:hypothetical protein
MALSDIVNVSISASTQSPTAPGFGVPLILGYHTKFAELVRYYTSLAGMTADGFASTSPEYLAAVSLQAQNPAPPRWAIGRRTHAPTQIVHMTPVAANATTYTVTINGTAFTYTTTTGATVKEIVEGLDAAIGSTPTDVVCTEDDTKLIHTGTAGTWFSWSVADTSGNANGMGLWTVADVTADSQADDDIAACAAADSGWYAFVLTHQNKADGTLCAVAASALKKLFVIDVADTEVKGSGSSDLASVCEAAADEYTVVCYHALNNQFMSAAWLGKCLPYDPGTETWKFKTLAGITADILTESEIGYIKAKHGNWYQELGGVNITQEGWTSGAEFIDTVRFIDYLKANIQYDVYGILVNNAKVPYTDGGVALIEGSLRGRLANEEGTEQRPRGLAPGSSTVTVPLVANELAVNRANRTIPDIYFTATLSGAIHSLTINGVLSV